MDCFGRSRYTSRLSRTRLSVATLLCCAVALVDGVVACAHAAPAQHGGAESGSAGGRSLLDAQSPAVTVLLRDDGMLTLSEAPESAKRPFKIAFYYNFDPVDPPEVVEYLRDTVMPTVASLLGRWIRVRHPSGRMGFGTRLDIDSVPIPPGPDGDGKYDADLLVKVSSNPPDGCDGFYAVGLPYLIEPLTKRPIVGNLRVCGAQPSDLLQVSLQFIIHELVHVLGFNPGMYLWAPQQQIFLGDLTQLVPADAASPGGFGPVGIGEHTNLITPNALREARLHFGCPEMEGVLLDQFQDPPYHFSSRHYKGMLMDDSIDLANLRNETEAFTDIDLGLLQDTGWYDVKYGSGGFNPYGYQAGCAFVNGTFEDALADPIAGRFICSPSDRGDAACFSDFSNQGICRAQQVATEASPSPFFFTVGLRDYEDADDCQPTPGSRCINELNDDGSRRLLCIDDFSCSATGEVLVEGLPCADFVDGCPPNDLMCGDPGLLTCATPELNDCNARGDCRQGRCFCHLGWGGDDCTIPACTSGCPGASGTTPCPPSGFCGVKECGVWSVGATGKGAPCTFN